MRRCLYWPPSPLDWGLVMVAGLVGTSSWSHLNWDVCKKLELFRFVVCLLFWYFCVAQHLEYGVVNGFGTVIDL